MRCKGSRFQNFLLRSRFYLTGSKSEISRKIPRLSSRAKISRDFSRSCARDTVAANFARPVRRWRHVPRPRSGARGKAPQVSILTHFVTNWSKLSISTKLKFENLFSKISGPKFSILTILSKWVKMAHLTNFGPYGPKLSPIRT